MWPLNSLPWEPTRCAVGLFQRAYRVGGGAHGTHQHLCPLCFTENWATRPSLPMGEKGVI